MRRLYWTYPDGFPGAGLLVMRLATGTVVAVRCATELWGASPLNTAALLILLPAIPAMMLIAGRWTPAAAALIASIELWRFLFQLGDPWVHVLVGTLGVALVLLGPGAWSADSYLFGWKPIHVGDRPIDRNVP